MRTLFSLVAAAVLVVDAGCSAPRATDTLVATSPDGARIAVASAGMRNVRVLRVSGGSVVRLREVFVPEGEAIAGIAWSDDGREVIVTTRGPGLAVDTRTWRVDGATARAGIDTTERKRG
jgi:WD40 repeat protein